MSYVQGTVIVITAQFTDPDTEAPTDPPGVELTVWPPGATTANEFSYAHGDVSKLSVGRYRYLLDTTPAPGDWRYELSGTGQEAIVRQRILHIRPRFAAEV